MSKSMASTIDLFLVSFAASVNFLLGFVKFINILDIQYYYFYSPKTINIVIFSPELDLWIWIVSLIFIISETLLIQTLGKLRVPWWTMVPNALSLVLISLLLFNERMISFFAIPLSFVVLTLSIYYVGGHLATSRIEAASLTLMYIAGIFIAFELASASIWILNIFNYEIPLGSGARWKFPFIDLQLFNVLYPLSSWLFLLFLGSWIWIPILRKIVPRVSALRKTLKKIREGNPSPLQNMNSKLKLNGKSLILCLFLSLAISIVVAYYPYAHLPRSTLVGVDAVHYYDWLREMMQKGPLIAFEGDRPFFNLLMYSVKLLSASPPEIVIRIMPMILAVCLSLAVYWFVKTGTKNKDAAVMSALFSAFDFQTTVGIFAYIVANWLAIIEAFFLLTLLLKSFESHSWKFALASTAVGIALLLTHPYTWNIIMIIIVCYLAWAFLRRKNEEKSGVVLSALVLTANLLFYLICSVAPFGKGIWAAERGVSNIVASNMSISNLFSLQGNLASMVQTMVGGLLGNPFLIILAVAGMFSIMDFTKRFNRIMLLWIMIPSLTLLAVSPDLNHRSIYLIPMQILAAIGLLWIFGKFEAKMGRLHENEFLFNSLKILIVALVVLFLLNYSLRSVDESMIHAIGS
jgi:hypothetical protein